MKGVDTIARIRREFFVRGKTIKEIVRELHVSRNTVHKVLRSGATEFTYEREVQPLPKLGCWKADLDRLLAANEAKPARGRRTGNDPSRARGRGSWTVSRSGPYSAPVTMTRGGQDARALACNHVSGDGSDERPCGTSELFVHRDRRGGPGGRAGRAR